MSSLETRVALDWLRGSLAQGSDLGLHVLEDLSKFSMAEVIRPDLPDDSAARPSDNGLGLVKSVVDKQMDELLREISHGSTLIVEDDLARKGDPRLSGDLAFIKTRVIRWSNLDDAIDDSVALLRTGSSGYPLVAYICARKAAELPLTPESTLSYGDLAALPKETIAVISSAHDAESYVGAWATGSR